MRKFDLFCVDVWYQMHILLCLEQQITRVKHQSSGILEYYSTKALDYQSIIALKLWISRAKKH